MRAARGWVGTALAVAGMVSVPVRAADDTTVATIRRTLQERYPTLTIQAIEPAPVPGLYEIWTGSIVVYTDRSADHVLIGRLVDTQSKRDLNAERLDFYQGIDFSKLPLDRAIKLVKGNGSRRIAAFEDPDCPYCRQLEKEWAALDDLTLYVFLLPLEDLHPGATQHAHAIWCSPDPALAWREWVLERKTPLEAPCDHDPIGEIRQLATTLHVSSTPTLFAVDGKRITGSRSATQLKQLLEPSRTPAPVTAVEQVASSAPN